MKEKYTCINCQKLFERYASTVRHKDKVCCSNKCRAEFLSKNNTGITNGNYKHGKYVNPLCECGRRKDPRSLQCSVCSGRGKGVGVDKIVSDEMILSTIQFCKSFTELAEKCDTSRFWITDRVNELEIDFSHFHRGRGRPHLFEDIFKENSTVGQGILRNFVQSNDIIEYICCECGNTGKWGEKDITLELHHLNGDNRDNRIDNLIFLCPNCHSQTKTYRGKKNGKEE